MRTFSILILLTCCHVSLAQEKSSVINLKGDLDDMKAVLRNLLDDYGSHLHKWDTDTKDTIWTSTLKKEKSSLIQTEKELVESLKNNLKSQFDSLFYEKITHFEGVSSEFVSKCDSLNNSMNEYFKDDINSTPYDDIDGLIKSIVEIETYIKDTHSGSEKSALKQKTDEISKKIKSINSELTAKEIKSKKSNDKKVKDPEDWVGLYSKVQEQINSLDLNRNFTENERNKILKAFKDSTDLFDSGYKTVATKAENQVAFKKYLNDLDAILKHLSKVEMYFEYNELKARVESIKLILTEIKSHVETSETIESDMNRLKKTPVAHVEVFNTDKYVSKDSLNRIIVMFSDSGISITASSYNFVLNGSESGDKLLAKMELLRTVKSKMPDSVTIGLTQTIQIETTGLDETYFRQYYNRRLKYTQLRTRFQIGVSTGWTANYRSLSGLYNSSSTNIIEERDDNEYYYHNFSKISFNVGVAHKSHTFAVNYRFNKLGFIFEDEGSVNSTTGLFSRDGSSSKVSSEIHAFGFQYEYTNYWKKWSPYTQCGLHALFKGKNDLNISATNRNFFGTSFNVGVGVSYKPTYCCSFYLCPTLMTMFNRKDASFISTRLYNYGVELGARINLRCLPKQKN